MAAPLARHQRPASRAANARYRHSVKGRATSMCQSIRTRTGLRPSDSLYKKLFRQLKRGTCGLCDGRLELAARDMCLSPSVDKILPHRGYTFRNCQVVHFECNRIKGRLPIEVVRPYIRAIMRKVYGHLFKSKAGKARPGA